MTSCGRFSNIQIEKCVQMAQNEIDPVSLFVKFIYL